MLDASDQERLREIEAQLLVEDPQFVALMRGDEDGANQGSTFALAGLWLIWLVTLLGIARVGWPVLVANTLALLVLAGFTWRVLRRRRNRAFVVG